MATQFNGDRQIINGTVAIADLSATGTPGSTNYLRGDNVWATVTTIPPNISLTLISPTGDEIITSGYSAYISGFYEIALNKFLEIGLNSVFEIG